MAININISIEKRHLVIFSCLIVLFGIVLIANAYAPGISNVDPSVMGHSANELEVEFGGDTTNLSRVLKLIDSNNDGVIDSAEVANSAGAVDWSDVDNKPSDLATHDWVNNQNYVTQNYVDTNDDELIIGCDWEGWSNTTAGVYSNCDPYDWSCACMWGCKTYQEAEKCEDGRITQINQDICTECAELDLNINV